MSRVGSKPIPVPSGVKVKIEDGLVHVDGPNGKLDTRLPPGIRIEEEGGFLKAVPVDDSSSRKPLWGLARSLIANAVNGVSKGFAKELDIVGIGYRAEVQGKALNLNVGFSHSVEFPFPEGIDIKVEKARRTTPNYAATVIVSGIDKGRVGQVAADIRKIRPPDPYKGKGIRYADEMVKTKVGKKGA